ncbi:MAG: glycerophosphodiester phosphodiesterase family protein [Protaetiibacter sp.]
MTDRRFIAHRGVHLGCTIAGENSLEAVALARRAGFACIETDVRLSSDGELVVMHDETLNRTAVHSDGGELRTPVRVDETPLTALRRDFRLKARDPENRTGIPTLEEYLRACADAQLLPFIESKLDGPADVWLRMLELADGILGRGGYVMTSNGRVNRGIRELGIHDVPLMDILYQAPSFADVAALGDVTVAISATRYGRAEHLAYVRQARRAGLATELHADDVEAFTIAEDHGADLVSTDVLAPDLAPDARVVLSTGLGEDALAASSDGRSIELRTPPLLAFGGLFLDLELEGACEVRLGPQGFRLACAEPRRFRHQVLVFDAPAELAVATEPGSRLRSLRLTVAEY